MQCAAADCNYCAAYPNSLLCPSHATPLIRCRGMCCQKLEIPRLFSLSSAHEGGRENFPIQRPTTKATSGILAIDGDGLTSASDAFDVYGLSFFPFQIWLLLFMREGISPSSWIIHEQRCTIKMECLGEVANLSPDKLLSEP
jgi:hypothetical protein